MVSIPTSLGAAKKLDDADPLASARAAFHLPDDLIYLDGHSLGAATHAALARVEVAAKREWADGLIHSWNDAGWIDLPITVGARLARLIGAAADEVIVCDSVSVNIFKLAAAALPLAKHPHLLIVEADEFPTDQYIVEQLSALADVKFRRAPAGEGLDAMKECGGVLVKSAVNYRTAAIADMTAHERAAADCGGVVIWDLSHAAGVVEIDLHSCDARLATGCSYKYLNGGPGAPAFIYVRGDIAGEIRSPIAGWFGHAAPFAFDPAYAPKEKAARFAAGTPPILSLSALAGALDVFDYVHMAEAAAKTRALGDLCLARSAALNLPSPSPGIGEMRGGHVSLLHENGYAIVQALAAAGVIADFRAPDAMRFGFSALYTRYVDVWRAMDELERIVNTASWDTPEFKKKNAVT
jgi:kynureninase